MGAAAAGLSSSGLSGDQLRGMAVALLRTLPEGPSPPAAMYQLRRPPLPRGPALRTLGEGDGCGRGADRWTTDRRPPLSVPSDSCGVAPLEAQGGVALANARPIVNSA